MAIILWTWALIQLIWRNCYDKPPCHLKYHKIPFILCSIPVYPGAQSAVTVCPVSPKLSLKLSVDELGGVQTLCSLSPIFNCPPINICASIYVVVCPPLRGCVARCLYQRRDRVIVNNKPHVSSRLSHRSLFINYPRNVLTMEAWSGHWSQVGGQHRPQGASLEPDRDTRPDNIQMDRDEIARYVLLQRWELLKKQSDGFFVFIKVQDNCGGKYREGPGHPKQKGNDRTCFESLRIIDVSQ